MSRFAVRNLNVLSYAQGFTLWLYKAPALADVFAPGYFDDAADMLATGDHMHVAAPDGGGLVLIASSALGVVHAVPMVTAKVPVPAGAA